MKNILLATVLLTSFFSSAQDKLEQDREAIKQMCGCFQVGFNFKETFNYTGDSTYIPSEDKQTGALEWAELVEDEDGEIVIQHLLIVGNDDNPMIIKHWRQDWLYENTDFYMFDHDNKWNFEQKSDQEVRGQWTQKVYQVDDSPRYEGSATWVHVDGKSFWENTTTAPLPRREYTQRSDYNVTIRGNRVELTEDGWVHDQDNQKIYREHGAEDIHIADEKGYNTYVKLEDSKCQAAINWWKENGAFWANVRDSWDDVFDNDASFALANKVDGKHLYEILFDMDPNETKPKKVDKTITSFVQKNK